MSRSLALLAILALFGQPAAAQKGEVRKADVAVYGGSAGGVIAAVAVAREGKTVVLLEPGKHVGGMVSGGLGATDVGNAKAIGGYSREFFDRVRNYYAKKYGPDSKQVKDCGGGFRFEPNVAEAVFQEMIAETKVPVLFGQRLDQVQKQGKRIERITLESGLTVEAAMFIDASYEGDLMARAKVTYTLGREGKDEFNESIAGVQKYSAAHQWPVKLSPYLEGKTLLPLIQKEPQGEPGAGDKKIQAYNFRLCMTQRADLKLPWPRPATYDPKRFELVARYVAKRPEVTIRQLSNPVPVPNGKTDTNNNGPMSTDHIGANWDYPEADYATRARIWQDHIDYQQGFFYFLAKDPRVPEKLRNEVNSWGLSKEEFTDTDHWPHQLYVRESRRLIGAFFMTQVDIMDKRTKDDSIGLGSYTTDSHHVQRIVAPDGSVLNEGDFQVRVQPYAIPYRSLTPKAGQCDNLLVPVCCSASHVAYGTIRMEPVYMILGQASGVAATIAIADKSTVQEVAIDKLQKKLAEQKAVLSPEGISSGPAPKPAARLDAAKLGGIVVDDEQAKATGDWQHSLSTGPFVNAGYVHDNNQDQGKLRIRFTPKLPKAGKYEVRLFFPGNPNRATNVLVVLHTAEGERQVRVNQKPGGGDKGHRLGAYAFTPDTAFVEIRNDGANGHVIADAVQWLPLE